MNSGILNSEDITLKLTCLRCKKYLSVIPTYTHSTLGSLCGRCSDDLQNLGDGFIRNDIYDSAIQHQKFPCINQLTGCLEYLFPSEVVKHETRCYYRIIQCPSKISNDPNCKCKWKGSPNDILDHFEHDHPVLILKNNQFEVDFVNNGSVSYIFPFAEEIYLIERNTENKIVSLTLSFLRSEHEMDDYAYIVLFKSGNNAQELSISERIGKTIKISKDSMKESLNDPVSVVANIDITKENLVQDVGNFRYNSKINKDLLSELECPVCFYYMIPPIYQCERGHGICNICQPKMKECPQCKGNFIQAPNRNLENIAMKMEYPCKYPNCKFVAKPKYIKEHEVSCIFGTFDCPLKDFEDCTGHFSFNELYDHIKQNHYEHLLEFDIIGIPFDAGLEQNITDCYIIKKLSKLFKVCFLYDYAEKIFRWSVNLIGSSDNDSYHYEIDFTDNNKHCRLYVKNVCAIGNVKPFECCDSTLSLDYNLVKRFIRNQLIYKVRIIN
ncbi:uncharacterized protein LOC115891340 isoform X2 [Sitophilus oryzae]|uniref:RING-type E3 ubiquitin transferase n=1 Tax=Sitophilus oryzae TaxID=7048 RepID=A0A6J2YWL7_SITOR|nr:uncharacterized protein LOC115891340 isoform X2 [Sitophilus oryzae]